MHHRPISKLDDVLARERAALLGAQYDQLAPIAAMKDQLIRELSVNMPSRAELKRLKMQMQSNLDLTSAALRGVAAANARISDLQTVRDGLTTYDQSGNVARLPTANHKIEKKA